MKIASLSALVAAGLLAGGLSVTSANAADLGGNCCADLEERIAELEATTARKGNRKVSLTVSGWVAEQMMWWDDGEESNVYVGGIGTTLASHVKFTGQATISPGWTAGYVLHIEAISGEPLLWNQADDDANSGLTNTLQSYWFIKSDHLGKVSLGKQSQASDNTAILVDGSGSLVPANWVLFDQQNFNLRVDGVLTDRTWGNTFASCYQIGLGIGGDCNGATLDVIRYDSPTFAGFSFSTSWGEDDMWDVAARYAGEFGGFKLAVAAAYSETTEAALAALGGDERALDSQYFQIGAYAQHVPTGLFVYGAYGYEEVDIDGNDPLGDGDGGEDFTDDKDNWYIKAGIRQRWTPLGHTVLYGEYARYNDGESVFLQDLDNVSGSDSEMDLFGLGVVQEIDAAAMSIWLSYRHFEGDISADGVGDIDVDDFDLVKFGALINF